WLRWRAQCGGARAQRTPPWVRKSPPPRPTPPPARGKPPAPPPPPRPPPRGTPPGPPDTPRGAPTTPSSPPPAPPKPPKAPAAPFHQDVRHPPRAHRIEQGRPRRPSVLAREDEDLAGARLQLLRRRAGRDDQRRHFPGRLYQPRGPRQPAPAVEDHAGRRP